MSYFLVHEDTFEKSRKNIRANLDKQVLFYSEDDDLNRKILDKEQIAVLLLNQKGRKDFHKQRNSGFNQVLAKLAKSKNVQIGINLDEIIESSGKEKAIILARIKQNIRLCSKNKLNMKFVAFEHERNISDLKSLGLILGMPTWMTKGL